MDSEQGATGKTQALVVADDPVYLAWLRKGAGEAVDFHLLQTHDVGQVMDYVDGAARVDLLFCEFTGPTTGQRAALIERMQEQNWQIPVVGLAAEENAEWVLAAMRAGARDFFVLGRDDETLPVQIGRLLRRNATRQALRGPAGHRGRIFPVLGGQPHEGIAFLAEHLALALNEKLEKGERAILVDLSTPAGAASIFLNISPTYSVLDAVRDVYRCDETLVETAFSCHGSGLYVLSLPEDHLGRPEFDIDEMLKLLDVLAGLFAYVVVAVDGHLPVAGIAGLIERSERVLLLSDQSILKSRHTKHLLRELRQANCPMDRIGLVVDSYRRRLGLEPKNLADLFELPLLATLTSENYNRIVSMNSGEPLFTLARKDPFCVAVRQLAERLIASDADTVTERKGLFGRLKV